MTVHHPTPATWKNRIIILMLNKGSDHDNQAACIYVLWRPQHSIWQKEQTIVLGYLVHAGEERQMAGRAICWKEVCLHCQQPPARVFRNLNTLLAVLQENLQSPLAFSQSSSARRWCNCKHLSHWAGTLQEVFYTEFWLMWLRLVSIPDS